MEKILVEIHKYDKMNIYEHYRLGLWEIVYMLIDLRYIVYKNTIFSLYQGYELKYHNNKVTEWSDSNDKMKTWIERNLKKMWFYTNNYIPWITKEWRDVIQEIYVKVNGNLFTKFELYLEKHVWITFLIGLLWIWNVLSPLIIKIWNYLKFLFLKYL